MSPEQVSNARGVGVACALGFALLMWLDADSGLPEPWPVVALCLFIGSVFGFVMAGAAPMNRE